jgi:hypothetical protein
LAEMAVRCWELDPSDAERPVRDIAWMRDKMGEICREVTKIRVKYHLSGQMEAENQYAEVLKFCGNTFDWVPYAFVVLVDGAMDQLGKAKPAEAQMDTGALGLRATRTETTAQKRKREKKEKKDQMRSGTSPRAAQPGMDTNTVMSLGMAEQNKNQALQFLALNDVGAGKEAAMAALRTMAGIVDPPAPVVRRLEHRDDSSSDDSDID